MPYCILAVTLLLTLVAARNIAQLTQAKERARFDSAVGQTREHFQRMINGNLILLDGLRGLANAKLAMTKGQFHNYVDSLQLRETYPGVQGLGYASRVFQPRKIADTEKIRDLGEPAFHIWPDSERAELYPVVFLSPPDARNEAMIGYDLLTEPANSAALKSAAETGVRTASVDFTAPPLATPEQPVFLLVTPVYWDWKGADTLEKRAQQLFGFCFCSFRLHDLFKALSDSQLNPEIAFQVFDDAGPGAGRLLYDTTAGAAGHPQTSPFTSTRTLSLADRKWTVVFSNRHEFPKGSNHSLHPFIMLIGTLVSFLLFGIALVQSKARAAAEQHAENQQSNEARFRRLIEQSLVGIYVIQNDRFAYVNPKMAEIFGYSPDEMTSRPVFDFIAPESRPMAKENMVKRLRGEVETIHYELRNLRRDGKVIDVEAHGGRVEYNGQPAILGALMDVTERKEVEAQMERQRSELQIVLDTVPALIFYKDTGHRLVRVNEELVRLVGLPKETLMGKTDLEHGSEHAQQYYRDEDEVMASGEAKRGIIEPLWTVSGTRWLQTDKIPYRDETGRIVGVIGFSIDITERKRAEERVQAQLSRLDLLSRTTRAIAERQDLRSIFQVVIRSLEEHMPVDFSCICLYDPASEELTVSCIGGHSAALALELKMSEQARIPIDQNGLSRCVRGKLVHEPDIATVAFPFPQRLARGGLGSMVAAPLLVESKVFGVLIAARRQPDSFSSGQCEFLRQLSEHVALASNQAQLYGALQQAYDDLRRTQQAVMQQERLRALGQMASGIAHDINNAISPVALYTESLIENEPGLSERARNYLVTIQRAIDDVAATVARMQEFYRQREPQMTLTQAPLNRLVQQVLDLTRARWSDMPQQRGVMIEVRTEMADGLPTITGVESEIRDALTNLIINAIDAMPDGGALTVRTRVLESAHAGNGSSAELNVCVEVTDTGVGMDEETRRRCLEPFFTTKGERGTGLGLAMVYGMAQRHAGRIEIESAPGRGSTVRLILPVSAALTAAPVCNTSPPGPVERLRLLIVDDDPLLIMSLRDILEGEGHVITAADGGQAGIDAFRAANQTGEPFAAVITDLGMPRVDGRTVAAEVKAASPSTPVILLTGWGQRLVSEGDVPPHVDCVLGKPPKLRELREALARRGGNAKPGPVPIHSPTTP